MIRVLLIGPYGLGNALMALPAIRALASLGQHELEAGCLLSSTEQLFKEVRPLNTLFKRIHALHPGYGKAALLHTVGELRRSRFDVVVAMFPSARPHYNLLNRVVAARRSVGSRYPHQPWWHCAWLNTHTVAVVPELHDTVQTARLLGEGLGVALPDPPDYVFRRLPQVAKLVGVHPGCKRADLHKRWGLANFAECLRMIRSADEGSRFRVFFGPDEAEDRAAFLALLEAPAYAGLRPSMEAPERLPLPRLFDAIGECSAFIANDSGLMHIAAAQGVRTLGLFGPSDERRTGPYAPGCLALHTDIPCRPCHHSNIARTRSFHCIHDRQYCLTELEPERIVTWYQQGDFRKQSPSQAGSGGKSL